MMPSWDQTGTPGFVAFRHFHSSTTSGSACLISARTCESVSPRQSPSSWIRSSICSEGFSSATLSKIAAERAVEVVERAAPAAVVRAHRLLVPQPAVGEAHRGGAVGLLEVDLDQHPRRVVVPQPGERQPAQRGDLRVAPAAAVLGVVARVAHHHPHLPADAQVDRGLGGLPVVLRVPPAPHDLLAGPRVEDRLRGRLEGPLDAERVAGGHGRRRRCRVIQLRATSTPTPAPTVTVGRSSSTGTPPTCAKVTPRPGTRRAGATTGRAGSAGCPRASPPTPPGGRTP